MEVETTPVQYPQPVKRNHSLAPLLPPCRVCGEKASGFHYGANTCEACKGFFRRSLQRKEEYKCMVNSVCEIGVGRRNACAHCRWRKCLSVGMSKTAIKTGRYTHEKKTKDIEEVKRLQFQEKLKAEGHPVLENHEEELENIIKHITSIHQQQTPHTPEFFAKLPQKEQEFLEQRELRQSLYGTMKPIPREEYMQIYQSTGIDIDGRREMIKHMIPCIEKAIKRFITFAKALPGFKDLPIDDQIALIKANKCTTWIIMSHLRFNSAEKIYFSMVDGCHYHLEDFTKLDNAKGWERIFRFAGQLKSLGLSEEECCMISAVNVLLADRIVLSDPEVGEKALATCLDCLFLLLRRKEQDSVGVWFGRIVTALTELREIDHLMLREGALERIKWADVDIPPIIYEFLSAN